MAIMPDPRDLAAKAAMERRFGKRDAWLKPVVPSAEDPVALEVAQRIARENLERKGEIGQFGPEAEEVAARLIVGDDPQMVRTTAPGAHPLDVEAARFASKNMTRHMSPKDGVIPPKPWEKPPVGSWYGPKGGNDAGAKKVSDMVAAIRGGDAGERQHAPGMEPGEDPYYEALQAGAFDKTLGFGQASGPPPEVPEVGSGKGAPVSPASAPADPIVMTPQNRQALIEAARANRQLPIGQQVSMPITGSRQAAPSQYIPRSVDGVPLASEVAARVAGPQMSEDGARRVAESRARKELADQMIFNRAKDGAAARSDRMGGSSLPSWMMEAGREQRRLAGDRATNERDALAAQMELARLGMQQQGDLRREELGLRKDELQHGRSEARRNERLQAAAAAMAAETEAAGLAQTQGEYAPATQAAKAKAKQLRTYADMLGNPMGTLPELPPASGTPVANPPPASTPIPGPIQGVSSGSPLSVAGMAEAEAKHAQTMGDIYRLMPNASADERAAAYIKQIGGAKALTPEILAKMRGEFGGGPTEQARIAAAWGNPTLSLLPGPNAVGVSSWLSNILSGGLPRRLNQWVTD